jgi:hypothetical protein
MYNLQFDADFAYYGKKYLDCPTKQLVFTEQQKG